MVVHVDTQKAICVGFLWAAPGTDYGFLMCSEIALIQHYPVSGLWFDLNAPPWWYLFLVASNYDGLLV